MAQAKKEEIITFKVDQTLATMLKAMPNRSDFIRNAILAALDNVCPLCMGTGIISPEQDKHWQSFLKNHSVEECVDCHAIHIRCVAEGGFEHDQK